MSLHQPSPALRALMEAENEMEREAAVATERHYPMVEGIRWPKHPHIQMFHRLSFAFRMKRLRERTAAMYAHGEAGNLSAIAEMMPELVRLQERCIGFASL